VPNENDDRPNCLLELTLRLQQLAWFSSRHPQHPQDAIATGVTQHLPRSSCLSLVTPFPDERFTVRASLRRTIALTGLTAAVVISGSIAAADGPAVTDITQRALATAPGPAALSPESAPDVAATDGGVLLAAASEDAVREAREARAPLVPSRGDRTAADPAWYGRASWYGQAFHGRTTANGETYDMYAMTAAHKTLPFGTELRVTNTANGRSVVVRINDRGPFIPGRDLDLSRAAAEALGVGGVANIKVQEL
jgi:rare lipoprotein A